MPESDAITLPVKMTFGERLKAVIVLTARSPVSLGFLTVCVILGILLLTLPLWMGRPAQWQMILLAMALFAYVPAIAVFSAWGAHRAARKKPQGALYTFSDEGMRYKTDTLDVLHGWKGILRLRERPDFLMLYVTKRCAHCLPIRMFEDPSQIGTIRTLARDAGVPGA